jgi:hypothetical protein
MESEGTPHFTNTFFKSRFNIIFSAKPKSLLCYDELSLGPIQSQLNPLYIPSNTNLFL